MGGKARRQRRGGGGGGSVQAGGGQRRIWRSPVVPALLLRLHATSRRPGGAVRRAAALLPGRLLLRALLLGRAMRLVLQQGTAVLLPAAACSCGAILRALGGRGEFRPSSLPPSAQLAGLQLNCDAEAPDRRPLSAHACSLGTLIEGRSGGTCSTFPTTAQPRTIVCPPWRGLPTSLQGRSSQGRRLRQRELPCPSRGSTM